MPDIDALFLDELARRGVTPTRDADGNYTAEIDGTTLSISLFNLRKDIARDCDLDRVATFADTVLSAIRTPTWDEAKPWVRWQLEPLDSPLDDSLHDRVSDRGRSCWCWRRRTRRESAGSARPRRRSGGGRRTTCSRWHPTR